ncbi:MAG: dihydrofolate reductase [Bacilli bacterium]|nr:dihydrofolate reductase [Bacilli bacterium]
MKLSVIAAIGKNNELGKNNDLIWHLPNDLKFFREVTTGKTIIMGKNTFDSLPKMLPNRHHIVLTFTDEKYPNGVEVFKSIDEFLEKYNDNEEEIFVIGGASIYKQFINLASTLYLTEIDASESSADVYFPTFDRNDWKSEILKENSDNGINYKHVKYLRK